MNLRFKILGLKVFKSLKENFQIRREENFRNLQAEKFHLHYQKRMIFENLRFAVIKLENHRVEVEKILKGKYEHKLKVLGFSSILWQRD